MVLYNLNQYVSSPVALSKAANTAMIQMANPNFDVFQGCTRGLLRLRGFELPKWFSRISDPIPMAQIQPRLVELKMICKSGIEGQPVEIIDKILPAITSRRENYNSH